MLIWETVCVLFGSMFVTPDMENVIPKMENMIMSASLEWCKLEQYGYKVKWFGH